MRLAMLAAALVVPLGAQTPGSGDFEGLLKQGFALHQQARFAEALPVLKRAWRLEPGDYFANLLLGIDLLRTGKGAEAVPRLQAAARMRPGEEIPVEYLGEAQAGLGQYAAAAEAYQRAVERGQGSEDALEAWAGFALERFRDLAAGLRASEAGVDAARQLQAAAAEGVKERSCTEPMAGLERRLATTAQGAAGARQAVEAAYRLSLCYAVEADKAAARFASGGAETAAVCQLRGDVLLRLKLDGAAAEAEFRQALQLRPGDPKLLERLAEAQAEAGETEAARQSAEAALAVDPHRREALRTLATLAMNNREYEQALPRLRQLAAEAPGDRAAQVELGKALAQTGAAQEALDRLGPALAAGYPDAKGALHALLARVLHKLGRDAEATKAEAEARRLSDAFQARGPKHGQEKPDDAQ